MSSGFTPEEQHFLQLLDSNPEFRDAVRRRLLSEELLELPARFAAFIKTVNAFIEQQSAANERFEQFIAEQKHFNDEQRQFNDEQRQFNEEQKQFNDEQRQFNLEQRRTNARNESRLESLENGQANIIRRLDGLSGEIADVKGDRTIQATIRKGPQICRELGLRFSRRLEQADLINLVPQEEVRKIDPDELESFENADLAMEATDEDGAIRMVTVEASHTADRHDTGQALRNAEYLSRFTGRTAHAVIASVENDAEVQSQVSDDTVRWHRLQARDLQPR